MHPLTRTAVATAAAGAATFAWAAGVERRWFALRRVEAPVLPAGSAPLKVLHLSDLHMTPNQRDKQRWVAALADLDPDLVVSTGDNLAHPEAAPAVLRAHGDLLDLPGVFVFGSNDYYSPRPSNPLKYLVDHSGGVRRRDIDMPWRELREAYSAHGWLDLTNAWGSLSVRGLDLSFVGVDDPHLDLDDLTVLDRAPRADGDLRIGVAHAPYLRVLDAFTAADRPLILAGHTHGGQVCVPGYGALVTNCDLDRARVKGLHQHHADGRTSWMNVSAGLGTSPFAPVRLACRPEATLLTLTPAPGGAASL
ncbi:metallophosphoesterase [Solicola sp. PLA-1-18]|uniref:metallophosphoesterase n=1 Tax=Solicola sp. PLA-1-18 TaxID=3380532 RepID=UPI003B819DB4